MIVMKKRIFIIKILFFIISNLLSILRLEVDTQQLIFPKLTITLYKLIINNYLLYFTANNCNIKTLNTIIKDIFLNGAE